MKKNSLSLILLLFILFFSVSTAAEASGSIVNPKQLYTFAKMEQDIKKLAKEYPDLIDYKVIGKSEYGRPIYAVSLGKGDSTVFINGSHHAREWLTTNLNMHMIEQYAAGYKSNRTFDNGRYPIRQILNDTTIWFVPMVNPDGVELQQSGLRAFPSSDHAKLIAMNNGSRDFRRWKANGKGVDLNRQYDANWRYIRSDPGRPSFANYKGPSPHSSSETKALIQFTYDIDPEMTVSYHSSGEILFWNFHQSGARYSRDLAYARRIGQMTGYRLIFPGPNPSGGGMTDWFVQEFKRPAFTPEIGRYAGPTNLPLSAFDRAWQQNRYVGLYVAQEGHKLYLNRLTEVAEREVRSAENIANTLTKHYIVASPKDVGYTKEFQSSYEGTQEAISKASRTVRQLPNSSLKRNLQQRLERTVELRRRATVMIRAINRGDLLTKHSLTLETHITRQMIDPNTVSLYETVSHELDRTERAIEQIVGVGNRRVMTETYTTSVLEQLNLLEGALQKYLLLEEIEEKLLLNEIDTATELFDQLQLITISPSTKIAGIAKQLVEKEQSLREQLAEMETGMIEDIEVQSTMNSLPAIGDLLTITILADQPGYKLESATINGFDLSNWTDLGNGDYTFEYIVPFDDEAYVNEGHVHIQLETMDFQNTITTYESFKQVN